MLGATLFALLGLVLGGYVLGAKGWRPLRVLWTLYNAALAVHFGRQAFLAWQPLVRISRAEIAWRYPLTLRWTTADFADVDATRWQDTFDLRLILRGGAEHALPWRPLGRRDRQQLLQALAARHRRSSSESIAPER